jgi:hypothetical protein
LQELSYDTTIKTEINEEFAHQEKEELEYSISKDAVLSIRELGEERKSIEIMTAAHFSLPAATLEHYIQNNTAKDKHDHTNNFLRINSKESLQDTIKELVNYPGSFLTLPLLLAFMQAEVKTLAQNLKAPEIK